ncbi:MAG: ATP-binding cassette domain-containing protein [Bacteroidales bacterium]|nr:ATP-binding cassette domain-containing protein [Bacteroidales bacterium]MDT8432795.1 ATP-binding cassette domain-containing protein [Bacteroidales bacterium]
MENNRIIQVSNLHKSFGDKTVINGVDLELFAGENLVVLGKSGTGKSVIMKCIVRLMQPDAGTIHVFGTDVLKAGEKELNRIRTRIGYLFQEGALYDSMSVRENLKFPAKRNAHLRRLSNKELDEIIERNLESVGLIDAIDKWPSELSGGMKKRAGLARSLMLSPEMIIYDEPTTGLDPYTSDAINDLIIKIREEYKTAAVIITHDIKCARRTSDRMVILNDGKIIANGKFEELRAAPDEQVKLFFI